TAIGITPSRHASRDCKGHFRANPNFDTTSPSGKLVLGFFASLAEFEHELIVERTMAGLAAARARGRNGGRPYKMTVSKLRLAMVSMGQPETSVGELCQELGITRQTLYRQQDVLSRHGIFLARSTLCGWLAQCAGLLRP